jgi:hypothetical protein
MTLVLALGPACAPSSNAGRAPRASADSAPEAAEEARDSRPIAPDVVAGSTPRAAEAPRPPVVAEPPPPPVAARPVYVPRPAGPYKVRIVDGGQHDLPRFVSGGRTYVMGTVGARYAIVIANPTPRRVEVVLSVDGLDAVDGHPANYVEKRGYILPAYGDATIEGFRTSQDDVATFRFSSVADSYAGRLGQARDVGVIGVAFFPERAPVAIWKPPAAPPGDPPPPRTTRPAPAPAADDRESSSAPMGEGATASPRASPGTAGAGPANEPPAKRPGLGTEFGEARASRVEATTFARENPSHPGQLVSIRYDDRAGLVALGIVVPEPYAAAEADLRLRESADPFRQNRFAQPPP